MTEPALKEPARAAAAESELERATAEALSARGPLAAHDAAFIERDAQQAMARAVARAIDRREPLVAEAGTGVGKTFAYLVPLLLSGRRALVSTATKALQDQLFLRDLPRLTQALQAAGAAGAAERPLELPVPASAASNRATAPRCPTASRCARCRASNNGPWPLAPATWPRSKVWTTARR